MRFEFLFHLQAPQVLLKTSIAWAYSPYPQIEVLGRPTLKGIKEKPTFYVSVSLIIPVRVRKFPSFQSQGYSKRY